MHKRVMAMMALGLAVFVAGVGCSDESDEPGTGGSAGIGGGTAGSGQGGSTGGTGGTGGSGGSPGPLGACGTPEAEPVVCVDQCRYVRAGATGAGDGSDWENAFSTIPDPLTRGLVYLVADGDYGEQTLDDPESGTDTIVIRKATVANHGTDDGWSDDYGDERATFGGLRFEAGYYVIDGTTGGGPGQWESGFGFYAQSGWHNVHLEGALEGITLLHIEIENNGRYTADSNEHSVYAIGGASGMRISHSYLHDVAGVQLLTRSSTGFTVECSKLARNGPSGFDGLHREAWSASDDDDVTLRFNIFEDISNTAFLGLVNGNGDAERWQIYGNVFVHSGDFDDTRVSGIVVVKYADPTFLTAKDWDFHHNAIVNVQGLHAGLSLGSVDNVLVYNNIWYHNTVNTIDVGGADHDYNWFFENRRTEGCDPPCNLDEAQLASEPNGELGTGDPFLDWPNDDYRLSAPTQPGLELAAPFDVDPLGVTRGGDGNWDRGPYEYE